MRVDNTEGGVAFNVGSEGRRYILGLLFGLSGGGLSDLLPPPEEGRLDGVLSASMLPGLVVFSLIGVRVAAVEMWNLEGRLWTGRGGDRRPALDTGR